MYVGSVGLAHGKPRMASEDGKGSVMVEGDGHSITDEGFEIPRPNLPSTDFSAKRNSETKSEIAETIPPMKQKFILHWPLLPACSPPPHAPKRAAAAITHPVPRRISLTPCPASFPVLVIADAFTYYEGNATAD